MDRAILTAALIAGGAGVAAALSEPSPHGPITTKPPPAHAFEGAAAGFKAFAPDVCGVPVEGDRFGSYLGEAVLQREALESRFGRVSGTGSPAIAEPCRQSWLNDWAEAGDRLLQAVEFQGRARDELVSALADLSDLQQRATDPVRVTVAVLGVAGCMDGLVGQAAVDPDLDIAGAARDVFDTIGDVLSEVAGTAGDLVGTSIGAVLGSRLAPWLVVGTVAVLLWRDPPRAA